MAGRLSIGLLATVLSTLLVWLTAMPTLAQGAEDPPQTMAKGQVSADYTLLEDPDRQLDLHHVRHIADDHWQPLENLTPNFSFSQSRYWIRVVIANTGDDNQRVVLDVAQPLQDYLDAWLLTPEGALLRHWQTGDRRPSAARPLPYRAFAFPMQIPGNQTRVLYLKLDTHDGLYDALPLSLMSYRDFYHKQQLENLWFGFCYGAIVVLLLYNLVVGVVTRSGNFLAYSLYLAMFLVWNLAFRGYLSYVQLPGGVWWNNAAVGVFSIALFYALTGFTQRFLQLKQHAPWLRIGLLISCGAMLYPLWLALSGAYSATFSALIPIAIINMVLILIAAIKLSLRGQRSARIFLLAWTLLILSAFAYYARVLGVLPSTWLAENALNIGSLVELLVLALALADRIKQLEQKQLEDKNALILQEQELKQELQDQVARQTRELRAVNERLEQESVTDSLTGLLNRRPFHAALEHELKRCHRGGMTAVLILLDIDHFKKINDQYGHPEGDRVLAQVAALIRQHWQRTTDQIYRLGGEEFAIVVSQIDLRDLPGKLDAMNASFARELTGPVSEQELTVSAGIAVIPPDHLLNPDLVYALADQALYESKTAGRNTSHFVTPGTSPVMALREVLTP